MAVGSLVIFPQGEYVGTEGRNTGGMRYHQGIITKVHVENGMKLYNGHHTLPYEERQMEYSQYDFSFKDFSLDQLRMPPNVSIL